MKRTGIAAFLVILALATGLTLFIRCSGGDMATVTIDFGSQQIGSNLLHKTLFERILSTFLTDAYAGKGDPWDPTHTTVIISVDGPGMPRIEATVPPYSTSYTIEIPSGSERRITVIAYDGTVRNTGGHSIINLQPGDNIRTQIRMLPILTIVNAPYGTGSLAWDYPSGIPGISVIEYYIYESTSINGPYVKVNTIAGISHECSGSCGTAGYFYKVSALYNIYGEGELSDPFVMP